MGHYSDISSEGTLGQKFLRGYQVTDGSGAAQFTTVYPGWYSGRAVHIRVPKSGERVSHRIDVEGTILLAGAAAAITLGLTWGGVQYAWASATIVGLFAGGAVLVVLFVLQERRAAEPVVPLSLFRNGVFNVSTGTGFIVGLAMFGAITYLPLYMQVVHGVTPTSSGLRLLPLMGGVLGASIGGGRLISRLGRYKMFPIVGTALMAIGMYLLSRLGPHTSFALAYVYMLLLGLGLGFVMQVLILAVQNAVDYRNLGVATSTPIRRIASREPTATSSSSRRS